MITPSSPYLPPSLFSFILRFCLFLLFVQYPSHTTPNMQGGALLSVHLGPSRATLNTLSLSPSSSLSSFFFSPLRGAHCLQWRKGSIASCPSPSSSSLHLSPPYRAGRLFTGRSSLMSGRPREILSSFALAEDSVSPIALLESNGTAFGRTLQLGALFGTWYLFNIYFNIYNKQVLRVFPFPITLSLVHLAVGSIMVIFMWITGIYKRPRISKSQLLSIMPLACLHAFGTIFTNMSLGKVSVSFTHTIKATEPFFTVILSLLFLGEYPGTGVVLSLLPIVGGVVLASFTEASFNWAGFLSAMASNLANQSRNVVSKQLMLEKEDPVDDINLFSIITIMSFLCLAPLALLFEGLKFTPSYLQLAALDAKVTVTRTMIAAVCFHLYQQVAYMILQRVSPVTHSVGNCVKRVVVIVAAVLFFRTPVSIMNAFGTAIALAGVFAYSKATQRKSQVLTLKGA